jgi:hypothetical protein
MTNETIVNRTPETFGQKLERERLASEITEKASELKREREAVPEQADFAVATQAAAVSDPNQVISLEEHVRQILNSQAHAPRDPDLREFREQVIRAFKHIGLDTVKFFN